MSTFIWSRFVVATRPKETEAKIYKFLSPVNIRSCMEPKQPENYSGNIIVSTTAPLPSFETNYKDGCYINIVSTTRDAIKQINPEFDFNNKAIDTKYGDGIEAWVNLEEEDMAKFEADEELLLPLFFKFSSRHYWLIMPSDKTEGWGGLYSGLKPSLLGTALSQMESWLVHNNQHVSTQVGL
ncbi:hypothetical protein FNV43_RR09706 [Rhamnella rubrinervis]|uniref:Uncharacterized protein n=1 Tax=Rhamnella rubrinervis TaxID=2594499 RepID=A0A8K0HAG4_9ROSA|nr:hypothetical protein FNV43_RR09706 [Rhamnella rubrinervis]